MYPLFSTCGNMTVTNIYRTCISNNVLLYCIMKMHIRQFSFIRSWFRCKPNIYVTFVDLILTVLWYHRKAGRNVLGCFRDFFVFCFCFCLFYFVLFFFYFVILLFYFCFILLFCYFIFVLFLFLFICFHLFSFVCWLVYVGWLGCINFC